MAANADIFEDRDRWLQPVAWSVTLHACLFGGMILYTAILGGFHGEDWGGTGSGGGDAMSATLVSSIPLPAPAVQTDNVLANQSKGLSQSLPEVKVEPPPDAIAIPDKDTRAKPAPKPRTSAQQKPKPVEEATNLVPFGQGGPVSGPYGVFNAAGSKGGFSFQGGGGDFGSRYGWYVDVVRRKVSENWLKYEIDPGVGNARRVYITFDITRPGQPTNIQVEQSSGVPSLDQSALRALQRIDTFGPLPSDYNGSRVSVEFWFDYRR